MSDTYRLLALEATNFKRLRAVRVNLSPGVNEVSGRNGQGKSTLLDAIESAFGGVKHCPEVPIRKGEKSARVVCDLGNIKVSRRWSGENSEVVVESKDGAVFRSPQKVLDELVGALTFDPLAFARMKPAEQAKVLREMVGLDTSDLDRKRKELYDERTVLGRQLKQAEGVYQAAPHYDDAPAEPVSVAGLIEELRAANSLHRNHDEHLRDVEIRRGVLSRAVVSVADAERRLREAQATFDRAVKTRDEAQANLDKGETITLQLPPLPDTQAIQDRIGAAEGTNRKVEANRERERKSDRVGELKAEQLALTEAIEALDLEAERRLAAVTFPIEGLTIPSGDAVIFQGQPLSQASQAETIRVGLAVGAALNPRFRLILVREGSLLDRDGMAELDRWSEATGVQVLIERVADSPDQACGIVIEDGEVWGAPPPLPEPPAKAKGRKAQPSMFAEEVGP